MNAYGVTEVNPITDEFVAIREAADETVDLADERLVRIVRLRLVTDREFPFWDLSYCYGRLADGSYVRVRLPQSQFPKSNLNGALIAMCKSEGRYGKGLGLFDPQVVSKLYG